MKFNMWSTYTDNITVFCAIVTFPCTLIYSEVQRSAFVTTSTGLKMKTCMHNIRCTSKTSEQFHLDIRAKVHLHYHTVKCINVILCLVHLTLNSAPAAGTLAHIQCTHHYHYNHHKPYTYTIHSINNTQSTWSNRLEGPRWKSSSSRMLRECR